MPTYAVIHVRMQQLKLALDQGDLEAAKWEFDWVLRAIVKHERSLIKFLAGTPPGEVTVDEAVQRG